MPCSGGDENGRIGFNISLKVQAVLRFPHHDPALALFQTEELIRVGMNLKSFCMTSSARQRAVRE
jgi:hypothetical protein